MDKPIGIFDSGIGGLTIWKEIVSLLPNENTIYIADSINAPYGRKSKQEIIDLCKACTDYLLDKGCKIIVVACNTATTNAIKELRASYDVPFIGIEPAIKPAILNSTTSNIGVLATKGTLSSELFSTTKDKYGQDINIIEQVGTGLVELIEDGKIDSKEMTNLLKSFLEPMIQKNIDHLVLGCSHYPFLKEKILELTDHKIHVIDSGFAVAKQTKSILQKDKLLNSDTDIGMHQLYITNNNLELLEKMTQEMINCNYYTLKL